jgi:DNA-directed RNA polymerase subunit RPC12/RpoP
MNFYHCENCKKFFDGKEIIIDCGHLHCPHCGGLVQKAKVHVDHRGGKNSERKIFKYPLHCPIDDKIEILMPEGSKILTVKTQGETPFIWAIVDTSAPSTIRRFCVRGTGHIFKGNEGKYIGTFQLDNGKLVFHLFEGKNK